MVRIDTLHRSLLVALPLATLIACGGGADNISADPTSSTPTTEQTAPEGAATPELLAQGDDEGSGPIGAPRLEEGEVLTQLVDDNAAGENAETDEVQYSPDGNVPLSEYEAGEQATSGREGEDDGWASTIAAEIRPDAQTAESAEAGEIGQTADALTTLRRERIRAEARRNTIELNKPSSYYTHSTYINESTDVRRTDCSGYVDYVLERMYPTAYKAIPTGGGLRPLSDDLYYFLLKQPASATSSYSSTPKWRRINYVRNLRPGDVLVWKNPSGYENTGHTMIVRDYPRAGRASRNEILVPIYDSTASRHNYQGVWDSRTDGSRNGIGAGTVGIKVDSLGKPIAYYWTGGTSTTATYRPMAMGRVE